MLEKLGKFFRSLFADGHKTLEQPTPLQQEYRVEAKEPTTRTVVEQPKPTTEKPKRVKKDNVVVAPIKKAKTTPPPTPTPAEQPTKKPRTPRKPKTTSK